MKYRIFISSVQDEFAAERRGLKEYLLKDTLLREYVEEVFIFEDVPAERRQPGEVYVSAVECADIFIGLYGCRFGHVFPDGTSPTEREYDAAAKKDIPLWLFYYDKGEKIDGRMARLRRRIDAEHTRREIHSDVELFREVWNPGEMPEGLPLTWLYSEHPSLPYNSLLADPLYLARYIERAGTGIDVIVDGCKELNLAPPKFELRHGFFVVTMYRRGFSDAIGRKEVSADSQGLNKPTRKTSKKIGVKTGVKIGVKTNKKTGVKKARRSQLRTSDAIIEMMRVNPLISYVTLAKMLGRAESTIIWQIAKLRKNNRIRRIGPDKGGHWEVMD